MAGQIWPWYENLAGFFFGYDRRKTPIIHLNPIDTLMIDKTYTCQLFSNAECLMLNAVFACCQFHPCSLAFSFICCEGSIQYNAVLSFLQTNPSVNWLSGEMIACERNYRNSLQMIGIFDKYYKPCHVLSTSVCQFPSLPLSREILPWKGWGGGGGSRIERTGGWCS